jgi:DNA gyrase subunit A
LKKAKERAHVLEGLKIAVENIDPIIELIKKAEGPQQAKSQLIQVYSLSDIQAQAILDMRLQRLTGLERDKIIKDYEEVLKEIGKLQGILDSDLLVNKIIVEEFKEILEKFGDERKTEIVGHVDEIDLQDLIKNEDVIVTVTRKGYIKRMATDTYKSQRRGGVGVKGASDDDDFFTNILTLNTHSTILFLTNRGTCFAKKVYEIPEGSRTAKGRNLVNLIQLPPGEKVKEILAIPPEDQLEGRFLFICTERGVIKKTDLADYAKIRITGIKAIKVNDGDSILAARVTDGKKDVFLCASSGKIIRFSESDCRPMGRVSQGVRGINLNEDEKVIGMEIIDDATELLSVTVKGFGKRSQSSEYRKQTRGGKGIIAMKLTDKNGDIIAIKRVSDKDDLMIITNTGQVIRTKISGISLLGRNTQGVRLINLKPNEEVVAVENIFESEEGELTDSPNEI